VKKAKNRNNLLQKNEIMKSSIYILVLCLIAACNNSASNKEIRDSTSVENGQTVNTMNDTSGAALNSNAATNASMNDMDRDFVRKVGIANTAEIEAGTMAQQKGVSAEVKDFGSMMQKDHSDAQSQLKTAVGASVTVPDSLDAEHTEMKKKLMRAGGKTFDKEYITAMVDGHRKVVALFEQEISGGSNGAVKQFATNTLPHIKMHLQRAESIKASLK